MRFVDAILWEKSCDAMRFQCGVITILGKQADILGPNPKM